MKQSLKVALVQFSPRPMREMGQNVEYIKLQIDKLAKAGNEIIVFPEMSVTNFFEHEVNGRETYWEHGAITLESPQLNEIKNKAQENNCYVIVGFAERSNVVGKIHNSAAFIGPEGILGVTRKIHFPGLEKLYYTSGESIDVYDTPLGKIGICICYDCMFPEITRIQAVKGAEIIVFTSSIWEGGAKGGIGSAEYKKEYWNQLPLVKAVENQTFVIACNAGGSHNIGRDIGTWTRLGMSKIVSPSGQLLAAVDHANDAVLTAALNQKDLVNSRNQYTFLADRRPRIFNELAE